MSTEREKENAQLVVLFAMMVVAVVLVAVAVGMFFGAQWGVALVALFAVAQFLVARHNVRKERREKAGSDGDQD